MRRHGWIAECLLKCGVLLVLRLETVEPSVETVIRRGGERPYEVWDLALHFPAWIEPFRFGASDCDIAAERQQRGCHANIGLSEHIRALFTPPLRCVLTHQERA